MPIIGNPAGNHFDSERLLMGAAVGVIVAFVVWVVLQAGSGVDLTAQQTPGTLGTSLLGGVAGVAVAWGFGRIWDLVRQEVALRKGFRGLEIGADAVRKAIAHARETGEIATDGPSEEELIGYARVFNARGAALGPIRDRMVKKLLADLQGHA